MVRKYLVINNNIFSFINNDFTVEQEINRANSLLNKFSENSLPSNVETILYFCIKNKIGFIFSRNARVFSCQDARSNRYRLGHKGIPLYDEFKSIILKGADYKGDELVIAAHCRGHMSLDLECIANLLNIKSELIIMPEYELNQRYHMVLGIVNPILIELNSNNSIINIFDEGLLETITYCPGTMMTNAGEHTWGIEFEPSTLINAIKNKIIAKIAFADKELKSYELPRCINPKSIGIITGNGPDSGMALWRNINRQFVKYLDNHFLGDISLPTICVVSLPAMGLSMELDKRNTASLTAISNATSKLINQDVDLLTLACNTTLYYTTQIRELFEHDGKKFISMSESVINYIKQNNIKDLALLGINFVANLQEYSAYNELKNFNIENIPKDVLETFNLLAYEVKKIKNKQAAFQKFTVLLKEKIKSPNVIIALTELSLLYESNSKKHYTEKKIIDPLEIYAEAIVQESIIN